MTTQRGNRTRSLAWEDEAAEETPDRRVRQDVSSNGRTFAATPTEMGDGDAVPRFGSSAPPGRPSSGWTRLFLTLLTLVLLGALGTGGWVLKTYLDRDSRFRIAGAGNIQATGLTEVSRAEMLPVFGEDIGRNIFFIPLAERRRQLEQIPWVERATVMRLLPDQIRVSIVERQPVAFVRQGQQVGLVDASGVLLTMPAAMMAQHHYSFPVLTGIDPHDSATAAGTRMAVYGRLLAELDADGQHLSEQISEIDLTDPEDARVLMPEQGGDVLAHFGEDHFLDRYQRYRTHIAEWRQQYPKLSSVDLRYDQQAVLQMGQGADATPPATAPPAAAANGTPAKPSASGPALDAQTPTAHPAQPVKASARQQARNSAKARSSASRSKAAKNRKKQAAAKRSALDIGQQRKPHPAAAPGQGQ